MMHLLPLPLHQLKLLLPRNLASLSLCPKIGIFSCFSICFHFCFPLNSKFQINFCATIFVFHFSDEDAPAPPAPKSSPATAEPKSQGPKPKKDGFSVHSYFFLLILLSVHPLNSFFSYSFSIISSASPALERRCSSSSSSRGKSKHFPSLLNFYWPIFCYFRTKL